MFNQKLTLFQDGSGSFRSDGNCLFRPQFRGLQLWHGLQIVILALSCIFLLLFFSSSNSCWIKASSSGWIVSLLHYMYVHKCAGDGGSGALLYSILLVATTYLPRAPQCLSSRPFPASEGGGPNSDDRRKNLALWPPSFLSCPQRKPFIFDLWIVLDSYMMR